MNMESKKTDRLTMASVAIAVLAVSRVLTPDASGYGTHTQVLMLPCVFHAVTHLPCPLCGLTTSFSLTARGEMRRAFESHLLGPPLFVLTALMAVAGLASLLPGTDRLRRLITLAGGSEFGWWLVAALLVAWPIDVWLYLVRGWT